MELRFSEKAWEDYLHWQQTDQPLLRRTNELIKDIQRQPFSGIGKPEALKFSLKGYWSRRINQEHRLVYKIENKIVYIVQCRYHY